MSGAMYRATQTVGPVRAIFGTAVEVILAANLGCDEIDLARIPVGSFRGFMGWRGAHWRVERVS